MKIKGAIVNRDGTNTLGALTGDFVTIGLSISELASQLTPEEVLELGSLRCVRKESKPLPQKQKIEKIMVEFPEQENPRIMALLDRLNELIDIINREVLR